MSIVVISYNQELYIKQLLLSILKQDFNLQNVEVIISDDCSDDGTWRNIQKWKKKYQDKFLRVIINRNSKNIGAVNNLNLAMSMAQGEVLVPFDGDDLFLPRAFRYIYNAINRGIEWGIGKTLNFSHKTVFDMLPNICDIPLLYDVFLPFRLLEGNFIPNPSTFFSRDIWDRCGPYDNSFNVIADYPFWLKLLACGIRPVFINKPLALRRIHSRSVSYGGNKKDFRQDVNMIYDRYLDYVFERINLPFKMYWRYRVNLVNANRNSNNIYIKWLIRVCKLFDLVELSRIICKKLRNVF